MAIILDRKALDRLGRLQSPDLQITVLIAGDEDLMMDVDAALAPRRLGGKLKTTIHTIDEPLFKSQELASQHRVFIFPTSIFESLARRLGLIVEGLEAVSTQTSLPLTSPNRIPTDYLLCVGDYAEPEEGGKIDIQFLAHNQNIVVMRLMSCQDDSAKNLLNLEWGPLFNRVHIESATLGSQRGAKPGAALPVCDKQFTEAYNTLSSMGFFPVVLGTNDWKSLGSSYAALIPYVGCDPIDLRPTEGPETGIKSGS